MIQQITVQLKFLMLARDFFPVLSKIPSKHFFLGGFPPLISPPPPAAVAAVIVVITPSPSFMQASEDQSNGRTYALQTGKPSKGLARWGKVGVLHKNSV
jgi:hypothetical protein